MPVDLRKQRPPGDEGIPHLQGIDPQRHVIDVHEVDAKHGGQPGPLGPYILRVHGLGDQRQIALDAVDIQVFKVPLLANPLCRRSRSEHGDIQYVLHLQSLIFFYICTPPRHVIPVHALHCIAQTSVGQHSSKVGGALSASKMVALM